MKFQNDLVPDVFDRQVSDNRYVDITDSDLYCKDALRVVVPRELRDLFVKNVLAPWPYCTANRGSDSSIESINCFFDDIDRIKEACEKHNFRCVKKMQRQEKQATVSPPTEETESLFSVWIPDEMLQVFLNRMNLENCTAMKVEGTHWLNISGKEHHVKSLQEYCQSKNFIYQFGSAQKALQTDFTVECGHDETCDYIP